MKKLQRKINETAIAVQNEETRYSIKIEQDTIDAVITLIETKFNSSEINSIISNDWGTHELVEMIALHELQESYTMENYEKDMMGAL